MGECDLSLFAHSDYAVTLSRGNTMLFFKNDGAR